MKYDGLLSQVRRYLGLEEELRAKLVARRTRPERATVFLDIASQLALRSTCARRQVGCILTDAQGHVLATGYNGVPAGWPHCIDESCPGARLTPGTGLDICEAIHAEQNALLQCADVQRIVTAYCTHSPCVHCVKLLLNTSCYTIYFREPYAHDQSEVLWRRGQRRWIHAPA